MKDVLSYISEKGRKFCNLPLMKLLEDESLEFSVRLAFLPNLAFFIMVFGDLNKYLLRVENTEDPIQELVNAHTKEDDHHWPWFLEDFEKLGWNQSVTMVESFRKIWGVNNAAVRLLAYRLCAIALRSSNVQKVAMIESMETTGRVFFERTTKIADQIREESGVELRYLGGFHLARESGHTQGVSAEKISDISLNNADRQLCLNVVDEVFSAFENWTYEAERHVQSQLPSVLESV